MKRTKLGIAVTATLVAAIVAWLRLSALSSPVVAQNAATKATTARDPSASSAVIAAEGSAAAAKPSIPAWEERLNRLVNLVGKVPPAQLDLELEDLAATLPHEDAMAVLNLQLLPDADRMPLIAHLGILLIQRWAERAPADAAQWLAKVPDGSFSRAAYRQVADTWGRVDLAGSVAWLEKLADDGNKPGAVLAVATQATNQRESVTALKLVSSLPPSEERDRVVRYSAVEWATRDRDNAVNWVNQLPQTGPLRETILGQIAIDWAVTEPAKGAAFALASLPAGKAQDDAVATSVRNWAVLAPDQAAAWVQQLPEGNLRNAAIESVAEVWAKDAPARAADWLKALPSSPSRDAAVGMYATTVAAKFPEQASHWAATIQDHAIRARVQEGLGRP